MYSWCGICRILICIRPCYFIFYTDIQSLKWQIYFLLDPRALVEVLRTTAISKFSRNILWYYWMPVWSKIEQNFLKFILDLKHKKVNIEHSWCDVLSIANYDLKYCHFKVVTHPPPLSLSLSLSLLQIHLYNVLQFHVKAMLLWLSCHGWVAMFS